MVYQSYLYRSRHNVFYLRYPIPARYHPAGLRKHVCISLGCYKPKEALRLSQQLVPLGDIFIVQAAQMEITYEQMRSSLVSFYKERLEKLQLDMQRTGPIKPDLLQINERTIEWIDGEIESQDYSQYGSEETIAKMSARCGINVTAGTPEYDLFRTVFLKTFRSFLEESIARSKTYEETSFTDSTDQAPSTASKAPTSAKRKLRVVADDYLNELERLGKLAKKTIDEKRMYLDALCEILGAESDIDISGDDALEVKRIIMSLPSRMRLNPNLAGMTYREVAALPSDHPDKVGKLLEPASIKKWLSAYSSFYEWGKSNRIVSANNFEGMNIAVSKEQRKEAYTPDQINTILSAVENERNSSYKWGVRLARYTGARLEEIAQLRLTDIRQENDIWYIDINDDADSDEPKSLKNSSSKRKIPLHSKLLKLGILDHIDDAREQGHTRLLYKLTHAGNNGYGRNLSRWFNDTLLVRLGIKKPELTFHSLRHTFSTELQQAAVEDSLIRRIIGHTQPDVLNATYSKGQTLAQAKEAIENIS